MKYGVWSGSYVMVVAEVWMLACWRATAQGKESAPTVDRQPLCGEGYDYFASFMKCDATMDYCFHYDTYNCLGPGDWGCAHALNRKAKTVIGKKQDTVHQKWGLGNSRCCEGKYQSPINIPVHVASCTSHPAPSYTNITKQLYGVFENNGNYPEFRVDPYDYDDPMLLMNVPFTCAVPGSSLYVLSSVKIHVGIAGRRGSEHSLKNQAFDGELQLVHVRRDFWKPSKVGEHPSKINMRCASQTPLGITIIAIFLSISEGETNTELNAFLSEYHLKIISQSTRICPFKRLCKPRKPKPQTDDDAMEHYMGGFHFCPGPKVLKQWTGIAFLRKKFQKDNGGGKHRSYFILAKQNKKSINTVDPEDIYLRKRKRRHQQRSKDAGKCSSVLGSFARGAGGKSGRVKRFSDRRRTRCFCRRRRFIELFLWSAAKGDEMQCRKVHYYRSPELIAHRTYKSQDSSSLRIKLKPGLLLPSVRDYYQYFGSLTSPPCSEVVNWIIMKQPLKISMEQLMALRMLGSRDLGVRLGAFGNVRPVAPLNKRVVTVNEPFC
ncbi:putative carbonic anhydrase 1 [Babylonia areolata]|uniref:putative carbonic anhydrase 1 n=1 Tax=Babylonia areolata TaxID=304850 RepID=UPI003FD2CCB3